MTITIKSAADIAAMRQACRLASEVLDYIMFTSRGTGGNQQKSFTANLSGQVFELPAGWVGFATGVEIRNDRGWRHPDALVQSVASAIGTPATASDRAVSGDDQAPNASFTMPPTVVSIRIFRTSQQLLSCVVDHFIDEEAPCHGF